MGNSKLQQDILEKARKKVAGKKDEEEKKSVLDKANSSVKNKGTVKDRQAEIIRQRALDLVHKNLEDREEERQFRTYISSGQNLNINPSTVQPQRKNDLLANLYVEQLKKIGTGIDEQNGIINNTELTEDDPAKISAQEKLEDLTQQQNDAQMNLNKANGNKPAVVYGDPHAREMEIRKIQQKLDRGNSTIQNIPLVYSDEAKQAIHGRNANLVTDEDSYIKWMLQAANAGMLDQDQADYLRQYDYYGGMPDVSQNRAYSQYVNKGIEAGIFDNSGDISMMSTPELNRLRMDYLKKMNAAQTDETPEESIEQELLDIRNKKAPYETMALEGLKDDYTSETLKAKPDAYEMYSRHGNLFNSPNEAEFYFDQLIYDKVHGNGAYNNVYENGTDDDFDRMQEEIDELWSQLEAGTVGQMGTDAEQDKREEELTAASKYTGGTVQKQWQKEIDAIEKELARRETVSKYGKEGTAEYNPDLITENEDINYWRQLASDWGKAPAGDKAKWLYWLINNTEGQETDFGGGLFGEMWGVENAETEQAKYRFMTDEMIGTFNKLYESGRQDEALAYMDALEPYLKQMSASRAEELRYNASKGTYGGVYGAASILRQPGAGISGTIGTVAALFGNEDARDPNSAWYRLQKMNNTVRGGRATAWGDFFANTFGEDFRGAGEWLNGVTYSIADNVMAMLLTKGIGGAAGFEMSSKAAERVLQFVMSSSATASEMVTQLEAGKDPTEAALYAIGSGFIEAITEKYSIEALLKPDVKEMLGDWKAVSKYLLKNTIAEGAEEGASDLLNTTWDTLLSKIYGHESELEAEYKKLIDQGLMPQDATKQVLMNYLKTVGSDVAAGALSGFLMSGGNTALNSVSQRQTGAQISNKGNTVAGYTGADQLVNAALGMGTETQSRKLAEEIYEKKQKGKKVSNSKLGRLAQNMTNESSEQVAKIAQETVENKVREELKDAGIESDEINKVGKIVAQVAIDGGFENITEEEKNTLSQDKRVLDVVKDFISDEGQKETQAAVSENAGNVMNVRQTVSDLMTGRNKKIVTGIMARDAVNSKNAANIATEEDLAAANGRRTNTGLDAVVDNEIVQVVGMKDGKILVKTENGTKSVDAAKVASAGEALGTLVEFADRNKILDDNAFSAIVSGIMDNSGLDGAKYVAECMNAYLTFRTGGEVKASALTDSTLKAIQGAAAKGNENAKNQRLSNKQAKVTPGQGKTTFDGAEYGTEAWNKKMKTLSKQQRNQAGALAEMVARLGNNVKLVNQEDNQDLYGWEENDGTITINVAARDAAISKDGIGNNRHLLTIASHELTHWLEQNSAEGYDNLRKFVLERMRAQGADVESMIMQTIDEYRTVAKQELDIEGAMAELVANACDQLLANEQVANALKNTDPSLYNKTKSFVKDFIARIKAAIKGMSNTRESRILMRDGMETINEIARIWLGAREEALLRSEVESKQQEIAEAETSADIIEDIKEDFAGTAVAEAAENPVQQFSAKQDVEVRDDGMVAVHNLSEQSLVKDMDMGGLPMASIGVLADDAEWTGYGDISLFFGRDTVDPNKGNRMYVGDAYTPTLGSAKVDTLDQAMQVLQSKPERDFNAAGAHLKGFYDYKRINNIEEARRRIYLDKQNQNSETAEQENKYNTEQEKKSRYIDAMMNAVMNQSGMDEVDFKKGKYYRKINKGVLDFIEEMEKTNSDGHMSREEVAQALNNSLNNAINTGNTETQASFDFASDSEFVDAMADYAKYLDENYGTNMAEVKSDRVTGMNEILAAELPNTVSQQTIDRLKEFGIDQIYIFDPNAENGPNSRIEIMKNIPRQVPGVRFSAKQEAEAQNAPEYTADGEPTQPGQLTPEESTHPESGQFSVTQIAESMSTPNKKLAVIPGDGSLTLYMEDPKGKEIAALNKKPENKGKKWVQVDGVNVKITTDMVKSTPVGMLINFGLSDNVVNENGMTQKETARKMFADLMNMCARYRDNNLIWEIAGSEFAETFSALKNNSDPQYRNTVDFGTICSKTQAIVDVLSETMKRRIKDTEEWNKKHPDNQRIFSGLTRQDIMMVYNQTHKADLSVPCPVCYVFSRWMGVPGLLGQMNRFQHRYVETVKDENGQTVYDKNGDAVIDWEKTSEKANKYIKEALKKYGSKGAITDAKQKLQKKIEKRDEKRPDLQKKVAELTKESQKPGLTQRQKNAYEERIRKAEAAVEKNDMEADSFTKELEEVEAYNWVTQALCLQHTEGRKTVNDMDENGNYIVDKTFRLTPEEILFDLNRTGEFAGYTKNWRYRTTRGAGMGKAIMPYSGASIGDLVHGDSARWQSTQNPFLLMNEKEARKAFENAKERVKKQNLVGGQRFQSTSDFRPEWGLDYMMSFLEMQALGSKVQMYTKVRQAVDFLGSIGADVNESIMASGNGWHIATEEEIRKAKTDKELASRMGVTYDKEGVKHTYVMDFSDVTGMDYNKAKEKSKYYNSVQMILVGMNDIHIRLALANDDIDFVIPWHSSGNSKDVLQQLVRSVDETLTESDDYTKFQEDTKKKHRTARQEALWNARVNLLQNGANDLTDEEIRILKSNPFTKSLYERFAVKGVDDDCYGVTLPKDQAEKIFPYEYWDKTSTRENADVNGRRFVEYCEAMGLTPRFAMFKNEKGYWKLLIDRKMFENNVLNDDGTVKEWGKYREQQVVDVTKAKINQLPTTATAKYGEGYKEETIRAIENSTAAMRRKYDVEPSNNPYVEQKEEEAPARQMSIQQEEYEEDEEGRQFSIDKGDMDVRVWMQGLTEGSVSTAQEKAMLKQYQTLAKDIDVERGLLLRRRQALNELKKNPNPSVYDRKKIRDAEATIEAKQKQLDRKEQKLVDMTSQEGFARLMYEQSRIMDDLVNGRTVEEVQNTIDDMSGELDMITKQMGEREKEITDLKQKALTAVSALEKVPGAEAAANQLKVIVSQMTLNEKNLQRAKTRIGEIAENAKVAGTQAGNVQKAVNAAIAYNNKLTEQSEAATWQEERRKLVNTLRSEHTQAMLRQQSEFKLKIQKDKQIQQAIRENQTMARKIDTNVNRVRQMLAHENAKVFAPEHMKPIAREMLQKILNNETTGRWKLTQFDHKQLAEIDRLLKAWNEQDGKYSQTTLQGMDDGLADAMDSALEQLQTGLDFLNASERNSDRMVNIQAQKNALTKVHEAVAEITSAIYAERNIALGDRRVALEDMAYKVQESTGGKQKVEKIGKLGMVKNAIHKGVISGNLTPEYFFKMLKNEGLNDLWEEYHRAENRNGLELQKAKNRLDEIAKKYDYESWDTDKRVTVKLASGDVNLTIGQIMALYATWKRENTLGPAMSNHLKMGGFYAEEIDPRKGLWGSHVEDLKAHRVNDADMSKVENLLTDKQKKFVDDIVEYMSSDMSKMGNEASMKAYGIKMYKEKYYYPFKMWDGIKAKASNDSGSAAKQDRAFHPSFSKTRMHGAQNALIIGDFMQTVTDHIVGMINYATIGLANENLQKTLNMQVPEGERLDTMTKRSIRAVLQEAYGREAMQYLEKVQEQLNGGVARMEKSLYDRALTLFRKNAVAGSLSVTLQQPLSYIRAAMMINPKYLAGAISPQYWKGSFQEMMDHSGVAVIKKMGRFDMGFGAGARDYITPDGKQSTARKVWDTITDKATILPGMFDQMTWTRMWTAVKMEQHALHPNMDVKSNEFLDMVGERFNDLMRKTQVYDSTLTKSQNMRSQNPFVKSLTSFMAEPTLTLNVLADAMQNVKQPGGKMKAVKALATFALSATAQAAIKAIMSSGRSPDEKKTWEENFLYRFWSNLINEGDPLNMIPGYNDVITLLKEGKLEDDALGMAGKISKAFETSAKMFQAGAGYREIEDGVGQIVQLITQLPAKNIMRDLRAMYNWFIGKPYADRETSAAVLKYQAKEAAMTADNLLGVLAARMGEAGYKTTNAAYYGRMFDAMQDGDQEGADEIREYLTLGKGVKESAIETGLKKQAKERLATAEADEWMISNGMMDKDDTGTISAQYKDGTISEAEAKKLLKAADPELTDDDIFWKIDRINYQKEAGLDETPSGTYYRLGPALETNRSADITEAIDTLLKRGKTKENIKTQLTKELKQKYLDADANERIKIRDELQKAYQAAGYTAEDANKTIEKWKKETE